MVLPVLSTKQWFYSIYWQNSVFYSKTVEISVFLLQDSGNQCILLKKQWKSVYFAQNSVFCSKTVEISVFTPRQWNQCIYSKTVENSVFTPKTVENSVFTPRQWKTVYFTQFNEEISVFLTHLTRKSVFLTHLTRKSVFLLFFLRQNSDFTPFPETKQWFYLSPGQNSVLLVSKAKQWFYLSPGQNSVFYLSPGQNSDFYLSPGQNSVFIRVCRGTPVLPGLKALTGLITSPVRQKPSLGDKKSALETRNGVFNRAFFWHFI